MICGELRLPVVFGAYLFESDMDLWLHLNWLGIKLLVENDGDHGDILGSEQLLAAVKTIIIVDLVMRIDSVLAIASIVEESGGKLLLLIACGILVSIQVTRDHSHCCRSRWLPT